jgi:anti-sigma regulatory factor (Ser/Thr protein kinase)
MPSSETSAMRREVMVVPGARSELARLRCRLRELLGAGHFALRDAELCVSELLSNAIKHTASGRRGAEVRVELTVTHRSVRGEVVDEGGAATVPHLRAGPGGLRESGRGPWIVAGLSADWGTERRGSGHAVWFTILTVGSLTYGRGPGELPHDHAWLPPIGRDHAGLSVPPSAGVKTSA